LKGITSKTRDRIVEVISRLLGSSSNANKGKGWKGNHSEYIHPCMIVDKDIGKNLKKGDVVMGRPT
jgi:hypothetical protein